MGIEFPSTLSPGIRWGTEGRIAADGTMREEKTKDARGEFSVSREFRLMVCHIQQHHHREDDWRVGILRLR